MYVVSPKQRTKEFFTSDKFYLPGRTQVAYEKNQVFNSYRSKYLDDDDLKYIRFDTDTHFSTIVVDIDGDVPVELLEQLIEDNIIPSPIYCASTLSMNADGYVYHRPHIVFALSRNSTVRRCETTKEIKNGNGKGKSKYVTTTINMKALKYYEGCRKLLCDLFEMHGLAVDHKRPNVVKSPFSRHWHTAFFNDDTYSLADIIAFTTNDVKKFQQERLRAQKEAAKQDLFHKMRIDSVSLDEATMQSMHAAVARTLKANDRRNFVRALNREDIENSVAVGNRNCSYFDMLRFEAMNERQYHEEFSDFWRAMDEVSNIILTDNPALTTMKDRERAHTFKSVVNWVWFKYKGRNGYKPKNYGAAAHLIDYDMSFTQKQSIGAMYTNQIRREKSKAKVSDAIAEIKHKGLKPTISEIARQTGMSRNTVAKYFKDGKVVLTNSPLFNALYAGAAVIVPALKRAFIEHAERDGIMPKVKAAAQMLLSTVVSGDRNIDAPQEQTALEHLELSLILEHFEVDPNEITFESLERLTKSSKNLYERLGVQIEWGDTSNNNDGSIKRMLDSLQRMENEREKQEQIKNGTWKAPWEDGNDHTPEISEVDPSTIKLPLFLRAE